MKLFRLLPLFVGVMSVTSFSACTDDDDIQATSVPVEVKDTFKQMFTHPQALYWKMDFQYYVADFSQNTFETEAWFLPNGTWAMTETDYGSLVSMLPAEVSSTFNDSQYSDWIVDDAKYYERSTDSFSIIEVETDGMPEIALFYDSFGNLVNKVEGDVFDITPNTVISDITF